MAVLHLYVWNTDLSEKIDAVIEQATAADFSKTSTWQTQWTSSAVEQMPNKVALHRKSDGELLGLMSYALDDKGLAVEIIYIESAEHSNANLLKEQCRKKKYIGIARALFAYAISVSKNAGYDGVLYFKAKTDELRKYYINEFGAIPVGRYDPYRLVIWEDEAQAIISDYEEERT